MWPWLTLITLAALVGLSIWGIRHLRRLSLALQRSQERRAALEASHQQTIKQTEAHQRALFNSMEEGLLVLDPQGKVRLVNQALERLFDVSEKIQGQTLMEALRLHQLQALDKRVRAEGKVLNYELELDGLDYRFLRINATLLRDEQGEMQGMILMFHDLTRLKHLEDSRKEFVANVSHELRTPLSMIKGYVETLLSGAAADPEVSLRFLRTIQKHSDRLTYLIEDLLRLSQLESGQVAVNLEAVELREVANEVLSDLQTLAANRQITLANELDPTLRVMADADRLRQVLSNLVDNAVKYGRNAGRVTITAQATPEQTVEIRVTDDGPGIPPNALDRIFERFYRVDKGRSREQGGTGLGLAIVKHIIQLHGGHVWAESEPGQGTRFRFTLPAVPEEPETRSAPMRSATSTTATPTFSHQDD